MTILFKLWALFIVAAVVYGATHPIEGITNQLLNRFMSALCAGCAAVLVGAAVFALWFIVVFLLSFGG